MEVENLEIVHLELKYCECCGGLWLRPKNAGDVYCESCAGQMAGFPAMGARPPRVRLRLRQKLEIEGANGERLVVICSEGGTA